MSTAFAPQKTIVTHRPGDEALQVINDHRRAMSEQFCLIPLSREFPHLAQTHRTHPISIADTTNNAAGAFKWRGAANALAHRTSNEIYAVTAGSHGSGLVAAAKEFAKTAPNLRINIVVPTTSSKEKKQRIRTLWPDGNVTLYERGATFDEASAWARTVDLGELIHPYDNPHVIAGQGTIVDDILSQNPDTMHIVVPAGGGRLVAGILQRLGELDRTEIHVHIVQAEGSDSMEQSLQTQRVQPASSPNQRFGGSAVRLVGDTTLATIIDRHNPLTVWTAPTRDVEQVIADYAREYILRDASPLEPTSVVPFAPLGQITKTIPAHEHMVVVGTGRNAPLYPPANYPLS